MCNIHTGEPWNGIKLDSMALVVVELSNNQNIDLAGIAYNIHEGKGKLENQSARIEKWKWKWQWKVEKDDSILGCPTTSAR